MQSRKLTVSVALLAALCIQAAGAAGVNDAGPRPLSVSALKERVIAPRIFTVAAFVVEKFDKCPHCPPGAVCETCTFGIYVADDLRPRRPGATRDDGLYLTTDKASQFQTGTKYRFRIRYRLEKNAAGAWQQSGPQLIDFARISADPRSE